MADAYEHEKFGEFYFDYGDVDMAQLGQVVELDPLHIGLDDDDFIKAMKHLISESRKFFKKKNLYDRRRKNEEYYLGNQIPALELEVEFHEYNARYSDNLIWESEAMLKPIALSRVPDLLVKPASEDEKSKKVAKDLTEVINNRLRKRENRTVLGRAYKHRPIYFIGVIKWLWDKEKGKFGDYKFETIHPKQIDVDYTSPDNNIDNMGWIVHHYDMTLKEIFMRFPEKKAEYLKKLPIDKNAIKDQKKLASRRTISEVWFTWYQEKEGGYEKIEGVAWTDLEKDFVFKKMKNPNWDWEGEEIIIKYNEETKEAEEVDEADMREMFVAGEPMTGIQRQKYYNNYFENPKKPFILIGYDQLGRQPYDETSRIEQVVYLQDNVNKRGKQITEIADHARGKNIFSTEAGLTAKDVEEIDMLNPEQDILIEGNVNEMWSLVPGVQPSPALFQDQEINRERVFAKMGAHATTRGEREAQETATGRQILREADYTKQDDEVEDTINYAAEKMAGAAMQMIKLRYTKDHMVRILGKDSEVVFKTINQDLVEDGMEVLVSASATDKLRRKREAYELANIQMVDPLSFFEDIEMPDPKGRTERLMQFQLSPENYYAKYVMDAEGAEGMANQLAGAPPGVAAATEGQAPPEAGVPPQAAPQGQPATPAPQGGKQKATMDLAVLESGQQPTPPPNPDAEYIEMFNQYINSPEFTNQPPEVQESVRRFAQEILKTVA